MPNKNYLCIQRSKTNRDMKRGEPTPSQMEEMYAKFNAWKDNFQDNIVDMGGKLGTGKVVTAVGATDGPFIELKEVIGGYMIISAESLETAIMIAQESPGTGMPGSTVEVREIMTP